MSPALATEVSAIDVASRPMVERIPRTATRMTKGRVVPARAIPFSADSVANQAENVSDKPAPSEPDTVPESSNGTFSEVALNTPLIENDVGDGAGEPSAVAAVGAAVPGLDAGIVVGTLSEVALKTPEIAKAVGVGTGAPSAGASAGVAVA